MLPYVPVSFEAYRPLKRHLHWTLQNLVAFADKAGRCFPSIRKLAEVSNISKSTISRHLIELERAGAISRQRRSGAGYRYVIAARFLPLNRVSHERKTAVPRARTEEQGTKNRSDSVEILSSTPWKQRLQGWQKSQFWLAQWGPKPNEAGCLAPAV